MRNLLFFIFCALTTIALKAQTPSIEALRTYADEKGMSPKEYIFKLFEKSDKRFQIFYNRQTGCP